jgi:hypothetical protein
MTGRERLQRLAEVMATVAPEKFDIRGWDCGATACAAGHAARDPVLAAEGLLSGPYVGGDMSYKGARGFSALRVFFGLSPSEIDLIFWQGCYEKNPTPSEVRERILDHLARNP